MKRVHTPRDTILTMNIFDRFEQNAVETLAANLKTRLLREAVKEWEQHRRNTEITPVMAQKLAADMVRRELAMEVYYSLSVKP